MSRSSPPAPSGPAQDTEVQSSEVPSRRLVARRRVLGALGVAVSAVLVALALRGLDLAEVGAALRRARLLPWLPLGVGCYLVGHLVRGVRCRRLAHRWPLSSLTAANVVVLGYAGNNLLPARLGELVRIGVLARKTGMPVAEAATITVAERVLDGLAIVLLFAIAVLWLDLDGWIARLAWVAAAVFLGALAGLLAIALAPLGVERAMLAVIRPLGPRLGGMVARLYRTASAGVACFRSARMVAELAALTFVVWLLEAGMYWLVLPAVGERASWPLAFAAMGLTNLGILVPSSPGFVGSFHWFCIEALRAGGVAAPVAAAYAVIVHLGFFAPVTVWGAATLSVWGLGLGRTVAWGEQGEQGARAERSGGR
jgi:glycosyltransferase 2 family protein